MRVSAFRGFFEAVPLTTFAPNVILSGLAARHGLRSFETRVPQHDRTTGEVSIRKWKLLKAAVRSFGQTIGFAATHFNTMAIIALIGIGLFIMCSYIPFVTGLPNVDYAVYQLAGKITYDGGVIYRDFFDHKGPFMVLVNYLGYAATKGYTGTWFIDTLLTLIGVLLLFIGLRKYLSIVYSAFICIAVLFLKDGGELCNRPESYALALSCGALGILLIKRNCISYFCVGVLAACVFMAKQTCVGMFVGVFVYLIANVISKKKFGNMIAYCTGGLLAMLLFFTYLLLNNVISEWFRCCIVFNGIYANVNLPLKDLDWVGVLKTIEHCFWRCRHLIVIPIIVLISIWNFRFEVKRMILVSWLSWFLWDAFFVWRTGTCFGYQYATFRCCLIISMIPLFYLIMKSCGGRETLRKGHIHCDWIVLALLIYICILLEDIVPLRISMRNYLYKKNLHVNDRVGFVVEKMKECSPVNLFVWGNVCRIYFEANVPCLIPYYYWGGIAEPNYINEKEAEELIARLRQSKPLLIIDGGVNSWFPAPCGIFDSPKIGVSVFRGKLRQLILSDFHKIDEFGTNGVFYLSNGYSLKKRR